MTKTSCDLSEERRKKNPRTFEETAKAAVSKYCDPDVLNDVEEPEGLASGKTTETGGFVHDDEIDDEDRENEK